MNRKSNASDPFAVALRILTYRDRSTSELAKKLRDRGFSRDETEATVDRCRELGYLDDKRFAATRARSLVSSGRAVGIRLLNELKKAGIDRTLAETALAEVENETDLRELIRELRQRKFPDFDFGTADDKEKNRVVNFLQRRGFPISMILDVLKNN